MPNGRPKYELSFHGRGGGIVTLKKHNINMVVLVLLQICCAVALDRLPPSVTRAHDPLASLSRSGVVWLRSCAQRQSTSEPQQRSRREKSGLHQSAGPFA